MEATVEESNNTNADLRTRTLDLQQMTASRDEQQHEWEQARANELALREVNERLDTFVAMAAHDLRSPVGVSRMVVQRAQHLLRQAAAEVGDPQRGKPAQA